MILAEAAHLIKGEVIGDGNISVNGMAAHDSAEEGDITFALSEEDMIAAAASRASCVLATVSPDNYPKTILKAPDMKMATIALYNAMLEESPLVGSFLHPSAMVDESAKVSENVHIDQNVKIGARTSVGKNTFISANSVIGNKVTIGEGSYIHPNVTIYDNSVIGNKVIIHSGTVIGSDGFGYVPKDGKVYKVPQMGKVEIKDNVEIGANSCIDRGMFASTVIGEGTKIDNQVQIAHNVELGKNVLLAAQVGIAGSSTVGDNTVMGGQVGVVDHVKVGSNVKLAARTAVLSSVDDNKTYFGYPQREVSEAKKLYGLMSVLLKHSKKLRGFLRTLPDKK